MTDSERAQDAAKRDTPRLRPVALGADSTNRGCMWTFVALYCAWVAAAEWEEPLLWALGPLLLFAVGWMERRSGNNDTVRGMWLSSMALGGLALLLVAACYGLAPSNWH